MPVNLSKFLWRTELLITKGGFWNISWKSKSFKEATAIMLKILDSSKYKFELTLKTFIEGQDRSWVFWFRTWLLSWASSQLSLLLFLLFFSSRNKASFSRSMLGFSRLAIKTTLWRVCTLRQRRYTSGQSHLDIKQQISRHLYLRRNTSFSVHLWNRVLFGAAVMYKQGWRYVGCRPSLLSSPLLSSQFVSAILLFTTGHWRLLCN